MQVLGLGWGRSCYFLLADDDLECHAGAPDRVFRTLMQRGEEAHDDALGAGDEVRKSRFGKGDGLTDGKSMVRHE